MLSDTKIYLLHIPNPICFVCQNLFASWLETTPAKRKSFLGNSIGNVGSMLLLLKQLKQSKQSKQLTHANCFICFTCFTWQKAICFQWEIHIGTYLLHHSKTICFSHHNLFASGTRTMLWVSYSQPEVNRFPICFGHPNRWVDCLEPHILCRMQCLK